MYFLMFHYKNITCKNRSSSVCHKFLLLLIEILLKHNRSNHAPRYTLCKISFQKRKNVTKPSTWSYLLNWVQNILNGTISFKNYTNKSP